MSDTKNCPYCGREILSVAKKCKYCGAWIEQRKEFRCPVCCEIIPENSDVCPYCHEKLKGTTVETSRPIVESIRDAGSLNGKKRANNDSEVDNGTTAETSRPIVESIRDAGSLNGKKRANNDSEVDNGTTAETSRPVVESIGYSSQNNGKIRANNDSDADNGKSHKKIGKVFWIIVAVIAILAIAFAIWCIYDSKQKRKSEEDMTLANQTSSAYGAHTQVDIFIDEEEFDTKGEAIAGYNDSERATIYEYSFSGNLFNDVESHIITLKYIESPVDDNDDGWFDVSGQYQYPKWQQDRFFKFDGKTDGKTLLLFTENSEMFYLVSYDRGYILRGDWYKYKNNQDRDYDRGSWIKHLQVELKVAK